jgi:hypothetical protein
MTEAPHMLFTEGKTAETENDDKDDYQPNAVIAKKSTCAAHNLIPPYIR